MIDKPHSRFCRPALVREFLRSAFLMPHAQEVQRRIQPVQIRQWHFPGGVALQIMPVHGPGRLPAETYFVQVLGAHAREIQARLNGILRKASVMLDPADALFRHSKQQLAVA